MRFYRLIAAAMILIPAIHWSLEITCPLPPDSVFIYRYRPVDPDLESLLAKVFPAGGYTIRFSGKGSIFRVITDYQGKKMVESGHPGYLGVRLDLPSAPSVAEFLTLCSNYLSITGLTVQDILTTNEAGLAVYRSKPMLLDGFPVLYDSDYAGPGVEMRQTPSGIWLKCIRIAVDGKEIATNLKPVRESLESSPELVGKKVVQVKAIYWLNPKGGIAPALEVKDLAGNFYRLDRATGGALTQWRRATGR